MLRENDGFCGQDIMAFSLPEYCGLFGPKNAGQPCLKTFVPADWLREIQFSGDTVQKRGKCEQNWVRNQ